MKRETRQLIEKLREVLANEPVKKAWLFGSYAREQEGPDSDLDLLVEMAPNNLTILGFLGIQTRLEKATNTTVDLIEDECLEDFARESANQDKILIYESAWLEASPSMKCIRRSPGMSFMDFVTV